MFVQWRRRGRTWLSGDWRANALSGVCLPCSVGCWTLSSSTPVVVTTALLTLLLTVLIANLSQPVDAAHAERIAAASASSRSTVLRDDFPRRSIPANPPSPFHQRRRSQQSGRQMFRRLTRLANLPVLLIGQAFATGRLPGSCGPPRPLPGGQPSGPAFVRM